MRKIFVILFMALSTGLMAQYKTINNDLRITKTAPKLLLNGSGALINFNNSDLVLTQSTNTLTLSGGNLALGTNTLTLTGSIGATGARATKVWATDVESTNAPTVGGVSIFTAPVFATSVTFPSGDTTVTAVKGKVIFKTADSTLYVCRSLVAKKWYPLINE